jgi:hypothetical protein
MRFGTWNVRSLYRAGSLMAVSKYKLDLVGVREVRWEGGGTKQAGNTHYFMESGMRPISFFVHKGIISAVKRVEFVSDRMPYIILRGRWCHIIVLNVHAPTEDKTDDVKGSFYEELERVFNEFPKYQI